MKQMFYFNSFIYGNTVLPVRYVKLEMFISNMNMKLLKKYKTIIKLINKCKMPKLNNAWLAGFTDGEGCFYTGKSKSFYYTSYIITQKYLANKIVFDMLLLLLQNKMMLNTVVLMIITKMIFMFYVLVV
uniref:Homing endonuclease LAGLIDADG domain-containing protein n=1 Tax=Saccharomyces cerevisiae TaxID=4932 RepID=A0A343UW60_YEASX|nr:hypothetical protein [Saccharomyces cerevisiae]